MLRTQRRLGYRLAAISLALIGLLTLLPQPDEVVRAAATPIYCILCGDLGSVDFLLNVLLFVPLGIGLALAGFSVRRVVVISALTTVCIELLQLGIIAGRDASLGDLVANTLGGGFGALLGVHWRSTVLPDARRARRLALTWALGLAWVWAGTAWALGVALPQGAPWYGAWAPDLANYDQFPGQTLGVRVGGEPLLPGSALDQQRIEDVATARPGLAFRAILAERPRSLAPIGMIMDGWRRDALLIGQDRQDLAFQVRMRAAILKLRTPTVNLRDGMAGQPGDTVDAQGELRNGAFELSSRIGGELRTRRLPLSASWGWSLVTPWTSVLGEEVRSLTAFWIVGLVGVLAYWSVLAGGATLVIPLVTVPLLLGAIPRAASFPPAHWSEWLAALVGILVGFLATRPAIRAVEQSEQRDNEEEASMRREAAT
jgi:hypothetical protein